MPLAYFKATNIYPSNLETNTSESRTGAALIFLPSVDIVLTDDQSKWTRCPVIELGRDPNLNQNGAKPGELRKSASVDKNGRPDNTGSGMSWFPGYAIDLETGSRLYMAFGENSFLGNDQGSDMKWNPSDRLVDELGNPVMGGMQPIYIFNSHQKSLNLFNIGYDLGYYDPNNIGNNTLKEAFIAHINNPSDNAAAIKVYSNLAWIGYPIRKPFQKNLASEVTIKIRVSKEYKNFQASGLNQNKPAYSWNMDELATSTGNKKALSEILAKINIVPNPYYAYSQYERNRLDTRVKITNLPEQCTIRIYSTNGRLIKSYKKDNVATFQDWDLNNFQAIPVASGIYIIHVHIPEVGDRILKFFAGIRNVDLYSI
jgi:hypothetical protein